MQQSLQHTLERDSWHLLVLACLHSLLSPPLASFLVTPTKNSCNESFQSQDLQSIVRDPSPLSLLLQVPPFPFFSLPFPFQVPLSSLHLVLLPLANGTAIAAPTLHVVTLQLQIYLVQRGRPNSIGSWNANVVYNG